MSPTTPNAQFDLSLATPMGRTAWAIAAILFGGAVIVDLATGRGGAATVSHQVTKPHAAEPHASGRAAVGGVQGPGRTGVPFGKRAWNEALMGESRLSLSPARVRHSS